MYALNNVTTTDEFGDSELHCPGTNEVDITVTNAAVMVQYAFRREGYTSESPQWTPAEGVFMPPGFHIRGRRVEGVRVKSAKENTPAQVTIEAVT